VIFGHDGDGVCAGLVLRFEIGDIVVGAPGVEWILGVGSVPAAAARYWAARPCWVDGTTPVPGGVGYVTVTGAL
jgi:hypothetical protein